jgi:hypothetical protein
MHTPLTDLTLPVVNQDGEPLDPRVKDAASLRSLYVKTRDADLESDRQRAKVQALVDGQPPYNQAKLNSNGQGYMSNFNPNDAKAALDAALGAYVDLLAADVRVFDIYTKYGTESERQEWSTIMSEEMGYVLRSWPLFMFRFSFIPLYFTLHGVATAYFEDCHNWQWNTTHLGYFKIPRQTLAAEEEVEYAFLRDYMQPHQLLRYVRNEEYAKEAGWNIEAVKRSLLTAVSPQMDTRFWMEFEAEYKNNDLVKGETAPSIPVVYSWVRECDGTYSLYLMTESELGNNGTTVGDQFLFQKRHAFKSATEAFVMFTRGIGTNGTYHSIRGLGADMFNAYQALMRLENRKVDIASSAGPFFQAESEEAMQQLQITPYGPSMLVSPGITAMNVNAPQVTNTIQPAINSLRETVARNAGGYAPTNVLSQTKEMTRFEAMAQMEQQGQLSVTSINLYNQPADRLAREVVRRFTAKGYQRCDPGGHYVWEWRERCMERGVPAKALDSIDHRKTRSSRVIGFGSAAARRVALQQLMELFPLYDDYGKKQLVRDLTASVVGYEKADVYAPRVSSEARVPVDYQIAELQNDVLIQGGTVTVSPSENKRVHLEVHVGKLGELIGMFEEAGQNPELFAQIVPQMEPIYRHAAETLDDYTGQDAPQYRQALQQAGEILVNGIRHLQKLQRQQEEAAMREAEQGGQPMAQDPALAQQQQMTNDLERRVIEFQMKLEQDAALFQQRMEQKVQDAALSRQLKAADTAADIARKTAAQRASLGLA